MSLFVLILALCGEAFSVTPVLRGRTNPNHARYQHWVEQLPATSASRAYRYLDALHRDVAPLVAERPGVVRPFRIGRTVERRPIWAFRVARPGTVPRRKVLVFAGIHSLEWISSETATAFLEEIARAPVEGVEIVVIPVLNVDGRLRVEADLTAGRNRYRRGNANGVDLNRDFAVNREQRAIWRHLIPGYYGHSRAPLSQPESRALDKLLREDFDAAVSLHAFGGFIYTPWAGLWERPADWGELHRLGTIMSAAQGGHAYKVRQLSRWGFFFRAQGAEIDHIYGEHDTLAFLVELTRSGLNPFQPRTFRRHFRWYNPIRPGPHVDRGVSALRALAHTMSWESRNEIE